jgi:hypothetical protein
VRIAEPRAFAKDHDRRYSVKFDKIGTFEIVSKHIGNVGEVVNSPKKVGLALYLTHPPLPLRARPLFRQRREPVGEAENSMMRLALRRAQKATLLPRSQ